MENSVLVLGGNSFRKNKGWKWGIWIVTGAGRGTILFRTQSVELSEKMTFGQTGNEVLEAAVWISGVEWPGRR